MFLLQKTKKALLSISDDRASSFFNTFIKIITPQSFLRAADFGCKDTKKNREIRRKSEKLGEKSGNSEKFGEKSEKFGENQRKSGNSEKIREIRRKIRENRRKIRENS